MTMSMAHGTRCHRHASVLGLRSLHDAPMRFVLSRQAGETTLLMITTLAKSTTSTSSMVKTNENNAHSSTQVLDAFTYVRLHCMRTILRVSYTRSYLSLRLSLDKPERRRFDVLVPTQRLVVLLEQVRVVTQ